MIHFQRTTVLPVFARAESSGGWWTRKRLFLAGLFLLGLGLIWHHNRKGAPEPVAQPSPVRPDYSAWQGSWQQDGGKGAILFRGDGSGIYSPDGVAMLSFRGSASGEEASFRVRIKGQSWRLRLSLLGDAARLVGVQERLAPAGPVVIAPGLKPDREAEAARRQAETRAVMVPKDFGTFHKTN